MQKVRIIPFRKWFRATIHGFILGIIPHIVLFSIFDKLGVTVAGYDIVAYVATVAYMQYKVLSKTSQIGKEWIWVAIGGFLIPYVVIDVLKYIIQWSNDYEDFVPALKFLLGNVVVGVLQSEVLKKQHFKSTFVYTILMFAVCLACFLILLFIIWIDVELGLEVEEELIDIPMSILFACMYIAMTGLALKYIQEQTFAERETNSEIEE